MKFFMDYVGCCMMIGTPHNCTDHDPTSTTTQTTDETRSLVTEASTRNNRRRKRAPTRGNSVDWRPSLYAISEDNSVVATPEKVERVQRPSPIAVPARKTAPTPQRNVKQCGSASVRVNAHSRSHDYCSREPLPMVIPTFSATPFMF